MVCFSSAAITAIPMAKQAIKKTANAKFFLIILFKSPLPPFRKGEEVGFELFALLLNDCLITMGEAPFEGTS